VTARTSSAPRIVFFDVGDTLLRADPSWAAVYAGALVEHRIRVDADSLAAALAAEPWAVSAQFEASESAAYEQIKAFDQRILARLGHRDLPDAVFRSLDAAFLLPESWHVFPDVVPGLGALRDAGIRTGIISNWTWRANELLEGLGLAPLLDVVTISAREGWQKPEPGLFHRALELAGVAAADAVHVGDSYEADVLGARRAGIRPVLIDRSLLDPARRRQPVPDDDDVPVVADLYGLLDLLGVAEWLGAGA
jgi:putative hydrolase of the HAD superfamily